MNYKIAELSGRDLDAAVEKVKGLRVAWVEFEYEDENGEAQNISEWQCVADGSSPRQFTTVWSHGGPLIESDQVFIDAPSEVHYNYGGKKPGEWMSHPWRATVSAAVRTYPNPANPKYPGSVGRGEGPDCLTAVMRAIVKSHVGEDEIELP